MGFLSGVLSNIKEHLGQHKETITPVIKVLDTNKHAGKKGFNAAIAEVVAGVRGYNGKVKTSNDLVKTAIKNLQRGMKNYKKEELQTKLPNIIDKERPMTSTEKNLTQASSLVDQCQKYAKDFITAVDINTKTDATKNAIKDLNPKLRDTIENVRKNMQHESKRLKELSSKESKDLEATEDKIKKTLSSLKVNVDCRIDAQMKELIKKLSERVQKILKELKSIEKQLLDYVKELYTWLEDARKLINEADKEVDIILKQVNEPAEREPENKRKEIEKKVQEIGDGIDARIVELTKWNAAGTEAVQKAKQKCTEIGEMVETESAGSDKIYKLAETMKEKAEKLRKAAEHIKGNIGTWVKDALTQVKEMDGKLKEDLWKVKEAVEGQVTEIKNKIGKLYDKFDTNGGVHDNGKTVGKLIEHLRAQLKDITGSVGVRGKPTKGLMGMVSGVRWTYVEGFKGRFTNAVSTMVDNILKSERGVKKYVDFYIAQNQKKGALSKQDVTQEVNKQITQQLQALVEMTHDKANGDVVKDLHAVEKCLTDFSKNLDGKVTSIVSAVGKATLSAANLCDETAKYHLESAIHIIVDTLKQATEKAATEIKTFITDSKIDELAAASNAAEQLEEKLGQALARGSGEESAATAVDTSITGVTEELKKHFPADSDSKVTLETKTTFKQYNGYVDQTKMGGALEGTSAEGSLPKAIGNIETQVTDKLKENNLGSEIDEQNTFTAPFSQITSKLKEIAGLIDSEKKDPGPAPGDGQKNGVNNYLNDITSMLGQVSTVNLTSDIKEKHTDVQGLAHIQSELQKLHIQVPQVTNLLMQLCSTVGNNAYYAKKSLTQLKNEYFVKSTEAKNSILKIYSQLDDLHNEIKVGPIHDAEEFLKFAEQAEQHFSKILKEQVENDIKDAEKALTSHARWQYVDSIKFLLQAFAEKAQDELSPLPKLIDTDLTIGFKGFMKAVEGEVTEGKTTGQNIEKLSSLAADPVDSAERKNKVFAKLSSNFKAFWSPLASYVNKEIVRLNEEENKKKHPVVKDVYGYHGQLITIYDTFNELMAHIHRTHRYDHILPGMLDKVDAALSSLKPDGFAKPSSPVIDGLIAGLTHFIGEMRRVYISAYDSETFGGELVKNPQREKSELTKEGRNVAKTFLTLLATLFHDLDRLRGECRSLSKQKINQSTDLGRTMRGLGYSVSVDKQDGELQNKETVLGENVYKRILWPIKEADGNEHLERCESRDHVRNDKFHLLDILNCICSHVEEYNQVSHCATFAAKRQPCSVFEMLIWFAGLPYNNAYAELKSDGFTDLLDNPAKPLTDDDDIIVYDMDSFYIDACPRKFTYKNIRTVLHHICTKSYDILCAIGGHGDADTIYGSDYCNNSFGMKYPQSGGDCLQMFLDVLRRILPPLRYLFKRCGVKADQFGWSDCLYGRDVATGKSQCNEHSSDKPKCQPTSPLMSYLNDCLPGHLPHQVSAIGCKAECKTCPTSKPGMPCLTPLGFRGFSGSTRKGWDLYEILSYFFGTNLISSLLCVVTIPPSTLPEHFGFALSLVNKWHESGTHLIKDAFHLSTLSRSIGLYDQTATLTDALRNAYGSTQNGHPNREVKCADLSSLSTSTASAEQTAYTAPYLHSLCYDAYYYVAKKHVNAYLSWALYLPWDLHKYLENLHDALKHIFCRDWGCSTCLLADKCKKGEHGIIEGACKCSSVVSCRGVMPTLYKYGFVFEDAKSLTASEKTCFAFIQQVQNVIRSTYFTELFDRCDEFLFVIRAPFLWMTVALWSLSLFYLICVMVGRLDVLHIRSHLRTPSSHKITAQSLLAAAQVGRLAKISYLQP
ncbi:homolog of Uncharacterized protein PF11_0207, P.falciparum [Babesia bigemina]|uniref:Homolog of Uncharacterized protein PF11_0207, P.falciparum n=1 Tax=Babesia bigemina TaxID=5866 RepID=A0A061DEL4_BABBI|nr:homolog of Uncharacterized protein PF11_0207, P.falciparum [Babesia bigemina]CDR97485.1 homolog of Uncharacterized protein PF11_0207, P.falciparum [Babesia bigemina]|eukprot:XP_012769671.1 homolog of Uncharacterized protein PF11_0207, P.falciparum [Babesia bigemina]